MADEGEEGAQQYIFKTADGETRKQGSRHYTGKATACYPNGDLYEGGFKEGIRHGHGTYMYASGEKYSGEWVDNHKHGLGTMTYNGKGEYQGYWENDRRHGEGVFKYPSGDSYSGWWRFGHKEGTGIYHSAATGQNLSGTWRENQLSEGKWELANGNYYSGAFKENNPLERGSWHFTNGNEQHGRYLQREAKPAEDAPEPEEDGTVAKPRVELQWVADKNIVASALAMKRNC